MPLLPLPTLRLLLCGALVAGMPCLARGDLEPDLQTFEQQVKPILQKYCVRCHGATKSQAKMRFDNIDPDIVAGEHSGKWEDAREAFNTGEMPPAEEPQPSAAERDVVTRWLDAEFKKAKQYGIPSNRGGVRRLTRYELRYALEDLLGVPVQEDVAALPEEGASPETGLKNSSRLLMINSPHLESYRSSAAWRTPPHWNRTARAPISPVWIPTRPRPSPRMVNASGRPWEKSHVTGRV